MTLIDRLKAYVLKMEWSQNQMDGMGVRCPYCGNHHSAGHPKRGHSNTCEHFQLVEDIRLVQRAKELEPT